MQSGRADSYLLVTGSAAGVLLTQRLAMDAAMVAAGIGHLNLLWTQPILAPGSIELSVLPPYIAPGSFVPAFYASIAESTIGVRIQAAVGIALPRNATEQGSIVALALASEEDLEAEARALAEAILDARGIRVQETMSTGSSLVVSGDAAAVFAGVLLFPTPSDLVG